MTSKRSSISRSVSVAVGSSMIRTFASMASALAISTRCWCGDRQAPGPARSGRRRARRARAARAPRRRSEPRAISPSRDVSCPSTRFSAMVRSGREHELLVDHRDAELLRVLRGPWKRTPSPSSSISPSSGARPARAASSASTCRRRSPRRWRGPRPRRTSRSTPSTAFTPGKRLVTARSRTRSRLVGAQAHHPSPEGTAYP